MKKFQKINQYSNSCVASTIRLIAKEELLKKKHFSKALSLKEMSAEKIQELERIYNCKINLEPKIKRRYRKRNEK